MAETANLALPLVASAQAQKHVTVNEGLLLIDALVQGQLSGTELLDPPINPVEGALYTVAEGATDAFIGQGGQLALFVNEGWRFITPRDGWRLFDLQQQTYLRCESGVWLPEISNTSVAGASTKLESAIFDHSLDFASTSSTAAIIPSNAHVFAASARVISEITSDTGTGWRLGVSSSDNRYGSGLGFAQGSRAEGLTGTGVTYYADTSLMMSCEGGNFTGGEIRIGLHYLTISAPL
ncbi:MAG: DUF2793 domain-containing protein [Pseudomonadota bacterium]